MPTFLNIVFNLTVIYKSKCNKLDFLTQNKKEANNEKNTFTT